MNAVASAPAKPAEKPSQLDDRNLFINRELSWLQFNARVLEEALDTSHPLLERVKFLAIFGSNLDEFFMVRVSGLRRQLEVGARDLPPDGMSPAEQLAGIRSMLLPLWSRQAETWRSDLLPKLREAGIKILRYDELKGKQRKALRQYFEREIFPVLTPLAFDPGHPFPHISNLSLNLAVIVRDADWGERFARIKVPDVFPRLLRIPSEEEADSWASLGLVEAQGNNFVWIEEVVANNLDLLFPGLEILAAHPFRVTRDADLEIEEDEASDLLSSVESMVGRRHFASAVRLEVDTAMPEKMAHILTSRMGLAPYQVYTIDGPLGMADLMQLLNLDRPELKDQPHLPATPASLQKSANIFSALRRRNLLLYHPYDSFTPVVDFVRQAAHDPNVLAIKQMLYRVGKNSPIVDALMEARENAKQVAVLVELKARFDEENNIGWARALEQAGVHVVYGLLGLKVHAKACLVVRREAGGIVRYVHLSTGNYNAITSRIYGDLGYFTTDPVIADDVSRLFNAITGYSGKDNYHKLLIAPGNVRQQIIWRIEREIERHKQRGDGHLAFKMNALVDRPCIQALYRASQAGVKIDLQVRGICCLRPGLPGISETINVTSIVGRFLEHARIYYFHNGGQEEIFLGSADLMPRNLDDRVETLFPIEDEPLRNACRDLLFIHLRDNVKARRLLPNGSYERVQPKAGDPLLNSQQWLIEHRGQWHVE